MRILLFILLFSSALQATHIIGGNFRVTQTADNDFIIYLDVFKDCSPGVAPLTDVYVRVFQRDDTTVYKNTILSLWPGDTLQLGDNCYSPPSLCVEEYNFSGPITLPDHPAGYIFVAQVCCRNGNITNIIDPINAGITWTATIPDPKIRNSTPDLGSYPPSGFLCMDYIRTLDLGAIDPDGDSLVYELADPYTTSRNNTALSPPTAPPYSSITWRPGYSATRAIPGSPTLTIDANTGILSCKPNQLGVYVFAYSVSEYRNEIKISEVRRDLQLEVLPCALDLPPYFLEPKDSLFSFRAGEEHCIRISAVDSNFSDTLVLTSEVKAMPANTSSNVPNTITATGSGIANGDICWKPSCSDAFLNQSFRVTLKALSISCAGETEVQRTIELTPAPLSEQVEDFIPNLFTPNGDGHNDLYKLTTIEAPACLSDLLIKIYNRWGILLYESSLVNLSWDGTFNGKPASEGVYFYVVNGNYRGEVDHKGFLTLMR